MTADRDTLAAALMDASETTDSTATYPEWVEGYAWTLADDILPLLDATRAEGAKQALRDAADALHDVSLPQEPYERRWAIAVWLRARADAMDEQT